EMIALDDRGGRIPIPFGFSMIMASLAQACHAKTGPLAQSADVLVAQLPEGVRTGVRTALERLGAQPNQARLGPSFRIVDDDDQQENMIADRISFSHDGARIQAAAITNLTTVAAKTLEFSSTWIDRIVDTLRAPNDAVLKDRGQRAFRALVHP